MNIVTMTTDFGIQDYYVAALKGSIFKTCGAAVQVVDVSHTIKNHDIVSAAFTLKNTWHEFPEGTIHVMSVNNGGGNLRFVIFEHEKHFFVGPDNGIFTLLMDDLPQTIRKTGMQTLPFRGVNFLEIKRVLLTAIGHLVEHQSLENLGETRHDILQRIHLQPVITASEIRGAIVHIDNYDNVILNITRETFEKVGKGRDFQLFFKRFDPITKLSRSYDDVPMGETLCLFNSDYLEIAVNMGKAAELLGLKIDDTVQIEFQS